MKITEVLEKMSKGDKAVSKVWKITILHDDNIIIHKCQDYPHLEGKVLSLTGMIMGIEDFQLFPKQITDYNEIKNILLETEETLTLLTPDNLTYYFDSTNAHVNLDFLNFDEILKGKWFKGHYTRDELFNFDFIEILPKLKLRGDVVGVSL